MTNRHRPPVVDAHHHFWRISRGDYHWMSPDMGDPLYRDYLPADLAPLLKESGVDQTILVQAAQTEDETAFLLEIAEESPFVAGVVGWIELEDPAFETKLDQLMTRPKFVGLRPMLQDLDDVAYINRPRVLNSLAIMAERGVTFDALTFPEHLSPLARALEQVPNLKVVIDHLSKPPIASGIMTGWDDAMRRVADFQNVHCKLSGMITQADHDTWTPDDLAPFIKHALGIFGSKRLMFGSDWPVCRLAGEYDETVAALKTVIDPLLNTSQRADVYGLTALSFYRTQG